ncbi:MAG: pilus assembly protein TadG-related protein, partial [Negativicutes bacterium]|nr:pilus assembly protein TadG-related protein [Negativicutes bacterium]
MLRRLLGNQKGGVLALVMAGFLFFMSLVGLVADIGLIYLEHAKLQNAVDAAALAGALSLPTKTAQAKTDATSFYGKNLLAQDKNKNIVPAITLSTDSKQINVRVDGHADTYFLDGV